MNRITISRHLLLQCLQRLRRHGAVVRFGVSLNRTDADQELLVQSGTGPRHLLVGAEDDFWPPPVAPPDCDATFAIRHYERRGLAQGLLRQAAHWQPLDRLTVVGPGMHVVYLTSAPPPVPVPERWSRTAGALGADVWRRITQFKYGIVGAGRTGSHVADLLASFGVGRLVIVDRDAALEESNLGEMAAVGRDDLGSPKSDALANGLRRGYPDSLRVDSVPRSVTHVRGLHAARCCDVLIGCVDHDAARLATSAVATLFLKPYLDIGLGIHGRGPPRQMGIDVRLTVPGERCLLCQGGLADVAAARAVLQSADAEEAAYATRHWQDERAGSLRSLNQTAAGLAMRLWEDFVAERVSGSTWLHIEFDPTGRLQVTYPVAPANPTCRLCRLAGQGEDGLAATRELFRER
jgi:hypothetical protein